MHSCAAQSVKLAGRLRISNIRYHISDIHILFDCQSLFDFDAHVQHVCQLHIRILNEYI